MTKDWTIYCEKTFNNLKANSHMWGTSSDWDRAITRDFYLGVFDSGNPNPSGQISENAYLNKLKKSKTVFDHCFSPQFIGRMIMDNWDRYENDYDRFKSTFWYACTTIIVTQKENESLSDLTQNDESGYRVLVPTNLKYQHLNISLYQKPNGVRFWKYARPLDTKVLEVPQELLEYEKQYLSN